MVTIKGVAHFSIPVSDVARSARFYTEVVGCRHLSTTPNGQTVFLDAAGTCLILVKPVARQPEPVKNIRIIWDHPCRRPFAGNVWATAPQFCGPKNYGDGSLKEE